MAYFERCQASLFMHGQTDSRQTGRVGELALRESRVDAWSDSRY